MRVGVGADVHEALGLKPQVQPHLRDFTLCHMSHVCRLGLRLGCCEGSLPACGYNKNPSRLVGRHHPSRARCLVATLPGLWVIGTLLDLWVETNFVPKLWYLTLIL